MTSEQLNELDAVLSIIFSKQLSDESWNCATCQEKKLDYNRACGYLPEDKRDPNPILPRIGSKVYKVCPISTVDKQKSQLAEKESIESKDK